MEIMGNRTGKDKETKGILIKAMDIRGKND